MKHFPALFLSPPPHPCLHPPSHTPSHSLSGHWSCFRGRWPGTGRLPPPPCPPSQETRHSPPPSVMPSSPHVETALLGLTDKVRPLLSVRFPLRCLFCQNRLWGLTCPIVRIKKKIKIKRIKNLATYNQSSISPCASWPALECSVPTEASGKRSVIFLCFHRTIVIYCVWMHIDESDKQNEKKQKNEIRV